MDTEDLTHRDLIVAMGIDGVDMTKCVEEYQKRGVTVFERVNSSVYSKRIVEGVGLTGAIRVSPMHCHTVEDIEEYLRSHQGAGGGVQASKRLCLEKDRRMGGFPPVRRLALPAALNRHITQKTPEKAYAFPGVLCVTKPRWSGRPCSAPDVRPVHRVG